uniref:Ecdysoneless homolog (Drosophila) n=1 Tax=Oncorhynchus kisutch TaxID=8019 RepID=A0A8C7J9W5_ONCKI
MDLLRRTAMQEDMVQYDLFLVQPNLSDTQADELCLQHLVEEILAKVAPLLMRHIWQQQPFNLKYHTEKGGVPAHIGGSTVFGDSVEDEWFIVYLLLQITQAFPELAARLEDNDGEFLLIEVADYLPKWLNPESSENRVFLHRGELYILPCPSRSGDVGLPRDAVPSVTQALALLSSHTQACLASPMIRTALGKRLAGYPEKIQANLHHAHCFLPAGIATVLAQRPDLVAPAVSAFYLRDPVDLQACRTFRTFPADTRVLTSVTFTRCLYAQMQQQHFTPDRRSGFTLPARSHPQYRAHELGMKLAHGFEILCSKCRQPSSVPDAPISCNPLWKGFLNSLKKKGYFRGELEGSAHYRKLMTSAENFFKQSITPTHRSEKGEEEGSYSLVAVTQGMKNFINAVSSHEGAELPCLYFPTICYVNISGAKDEELDSDDLDDDDDDDDRVKGPTGPLGVGPEALEDLRKYMDEMDHELMGTNIGQSFNQQDTSKAGPGQEDLLGEDEEEIQPLNIDLNLVTNLLESLSSQAGLAGPASNLLHSLGIHLPPNTDRS